ncbi:hypothetical protein D1BOALGB6SA_5048 [Olavius sp. associated proteobacterium Delta 1]|nr:hypothetical protein D1BOALGB6SA_5048 [Olavius sp. associated proteobacterium Delta 1]
MLNEELFSSFPTNCLTKYVNRTRLSIAINRNINAVRILHDVEGVEHLRSVNRNPFYGIKMIEEIIQRNVFEIVDLKDADDSNYWHGRGPIERVEAIEFMRKVMFGNDRVSKRLQRVLTVVELKRS